MTNKEKLELNESELEKVAGGKAHIEGWTSYQGTCPCGLTFEVNDRYNDNETFVCSCNRTYTLVIGQVYCDNELLPTSAYTIETGQ